MYLLDDAECVECKCLITAPTPLDHPDYEVNQMTCTKYGCNFELDLDGQVTCTVCGAMDDDLQPINIDKI